MIKESYISTMNQSIHTLITNAIKISVKRPAVARFVLTYFAHQKKAVSLRASFEEQNYKIPPFLIASITNRCNLKCSGCYAMINQAHHKNELTSDEWFNIFKEAKILGISFILIGGGEPFLRPDLLEKAGKIPEIVFPVFTNGTYIHDEEISLLSRNRNILPIISVEGLEAETDNRRGIGVHKQAIDVMRKLNQKDIFFGTSITVTKENYALVTSESFVNSLIVEGCQILFYIEYVPFDESTKHLVVTQEQRESLNLILDDLRTKYSALFIAFPGDEDQFGGCLSSGRGFAHINVTGDLEPCPFSPYSDVNLKDMSLKDALQSNFLKSIRESNEHLSETENGCALFNKKDWVVSLLHKQSV